ncbi:Beta-ketoacyl synthase [Metarhizium guizhouense ARSEF 977]|uniref:Beta-ketoacyl synthase n=1 Tax=Metarhizium guizhouense (strain ARSEF 977) TaxID=1276136 RepID=A0A0B4G882_METGA|nr:Beta-ketoacyl synthase [Metarhizium guizhouense ARSEF 977]
MTYDKWRRAFVPKTRGSRNLLAQLWPGDEPFFILPSSITGIIGNTPQSNYAAGNTFEDALAQHARHHLGIRATGIDHGWNVLQTNLEELRFALMASGSTGFERDGKFDLRVFGEVDQGDGSTKEESVGDKIKKATSLAEAAAAVELSLRKQIAISIGVHSDEVDVQRPLPEFGGKYWFCYDELPTPY